jgi:peptidoglycan-associated lipoprotein
MNKTLIIIGLLSMVYGCNYTLKVKDGKTAYDLKQYAVAANFLQKEYTKAKTKGEKGKIAFQLGESFRQLHNDTKAATWYKQAYDNASNLDALREYTYCLKRSENYKEAAAAFKNLGLEVGSPYEYRREITACNVAAAWIEDAKYAGYIVEAAGFNSAAADYSPAVIEGGKVVISSDRTTSTGDANYTWTGNKFSDLYIVENNTAKNFDKQINTPFNEATAAFSGDNTDMFFTKSGGESETIQTTKIYYSKKVGNAWTTPEVLPFCKEKINYSTPSVSKDGKTLFFASNDPEGWGGYDLYECKKTNDGFVEPKVIGRSLNTQGNEAYPYSDGDTLYFASDFHTGMGGYDIFKTYRLNDGSWASPQNMKFPVNSGSDDFGYTIDNQSIKSEGIIQQGYFTSNRIGGKGGDDIYKFERRTPLPRPVVVVPDKPKETKPIEYKNFLDIIVLEKVFQYSDNPNSKVMGRKPLAESKVSVLLNGKKRELTVNTEGVASLELDTDADYNLTATHEGYLNNSGKFTSRGLGRDVNNPIQRFEVEIVLDKIYKNKEITLDNIYYDYDKWDIRSDAQPTLNRLAETLLENPSVKIQLSSHTDCRGKDDYNAVLSQKRAESAVNFLISKGIPTDRLTAKGYGESSPASPCDCAKCTEDQHQVNRRTTFKVLE